MRTKLWQFSRLFWSSRNQKSVIFELAPGPRLALGALGPLTFTTLFKMAICYFSFKIYSRKSVFTSQ